MAARIAGLALFLGAPLLGLVWMWWSVAELLAR